MARHKVIPPKRRAAELAYDVIERLFATLVLVPGTPIVEGEIVERTGLGRTPVREALLRMASLGLIVQQPRRGLMVSNIDLADYLDVIATRRVLENLIASSAARRASRQQREQILLQAESMMAAADTRDLDAYMQADHDLDVVTHQACGNESAVNCVLPLVVQCRRFWYSYQDAGEIKEGAAAHLELAKGITTGDEALAMAGATRLMDYLERFARKVIDR